MNCNYIGYARVSTKEQNEDRQIIALVEFGVAETSIFVDKTSGKDFERDNYKKMLKKMKTGQILVVKSIDRLGRNYEEIIEQWQFITKKVGADIIVLDMPLLNTTIHKDLLGTFISDIVLQILSFVAQNERENIKQRQAEGIANAKVKGIKFGRPVKFRAIEYIDIYRRYKHKEISISEAMGLIGCGRFTFYRMMKELKENKYI